MTPRLRLIDRLAVALTGLLLVAAAMTALTWHYRHPRSALVASAAWLHTSPHTACWPWALSAAGLLLLGLAAWWAIAHLPRPTHCITRLPGTDPSGQLRLDLSTVAHTAANVLASHDAITGAKATIYREHGRDIIEIAATTAADDLPAATHAATSTHHELAAVLSAVPTPVRTLLHLKTTHRHRNRVH